MVRIGTLRSRPALGLAAAALLIAASARAAEPENEESRFSFYRAGGDFLRLDGETGQVSLCNKHAAGWLCQAMPEERAALEAEIARLQVENAALKKAMLTHGLPLPGGAQARAPRDAPPASPAAEPGLVNRGLSAINTMVADIWRRLVSLVAG
jgi:hypothetical protein